MTKNFDIATDIFGEQINIGDVIAFPELSSNKLFAQIHFGIIEDIEYANDSYYRVHLLYATEKHGHVNITHRIRDGNCIKVDKEQYTLFRMKKENTM